MWILSIVGSKIGRIIATVLAVGLSLFLVIQYIQSQEKDRVINTIKIQNLENDVKIRERVNENINSVRETNPARDGSVALEFLRSRQFNTTGR